MANTEVLIYSLSPNPTLQVDEAEFNKRLSASIEANPTFSASSVRMPVLGYTGFKLSRKDGSEVVVYRRWVEVIEGGEKKFFKDTTDEFEAGLEEWLYSQATQGDAPALNETQAAEVQHVRPYGPE